MGTARRPASNHICAGGELVDDIELPLTPDFVDETTNEAFVLTEHGETSSRLVADFVCPPSARLVCQWATGIGRSPYISLMDLSTGCRAPDRVGAHRGSL